MIKPYFFQFYGVKIQFFEHISKKQTSTQSVTDIFVVYLWGKFKVIDWVLVHFFRYGQKTRFLLHKTGKNRVLPQIYKRLKNGLFISKNEKFQLISF